MIFKQVQEIIEGTKTQTRRVVKGGEFGVPTKYPNGVYSPRLVIGEVKKWHPIHQPDTARLKWQVGRDYAVVPKRGEPGVWWHPMAKTWRGPTRKLSGLDVEIARITSIHREPLQAITEADAIAEGCKGKTVYTGYTNEDQPDYDMTPRDVYRELWESINGAGSWDKAGDVWVIEFEVVTQ
jgi:hypothetical protein